MSKDYYKTLGVERGASAGDIKKAFYKKAQQYHPDKAGGDEAKFKEVNEAYQVLSNDQKRAQYDQFGSAGPGGAGFGGGAQGFGGFDFSGFQGQGFGGIDLEDLFSAAFGGGRRVPRGRDIAIEIALSFEEMVNGVERSIEVPDIRDGQERSKSKKLTVSIPAGIESGQRVRLAGHGEEISQGRSGDVYVTLRIEKHPDFMRDGNDLIYLLPVKLSDALAGTKTKIQRFDRELTIKIPSGLKSGEVLRVRGEGIQGRHKGDLLIKTSIIMPKKLNKNLKKATEIFKDEGY